MDLCIRNYEKCADDTLKQPGSVINVGVVNDPIYAYVSDHNDVRSITYGPELEATKLLCDTLDLNCHYHLTVDKNYFTYVNGTWGGLLGDLLNGTYDMSLPVFYRTELREKYFSVSNPALYEVTYFVTRNQDTNDSDFPVTGGFLAPFKWTTWIVLSLVITVMSLFIFTLQQKKHTFSDLVITHVNMASLLIRKGQRLPKLNVAGKTIFLFWSTSVVIITAYYTNGLLASMMPLPPKLPFTDIPTLIECLNAEKCRFIMSGDDHFNKTVSDNNTPYFHFFKEILDNHPTAVSRNHTDTLNQIINTKHLYLVSVPKEYQEISLMHQYNDSCSLLFLEIHATLHFIVRKNKSLENKVNRAITVMNQQGLLPKISSKEPRIARCLVQDSMGKLKKTSAKPLQLRWLIGMLLICTFGFLTALLCLLSELVSSRLSHHT